MRFCPYCSADNTDQAIECRQCGRRFLPLPAPPLEGANGGEAPSPPRSASAPAGPLAAPQPAPPRWSMHGAPPAGVATAERVVVPRPWNAGPPAATGQGLVVPAAARSGRTAPLPSSADESIRSTRSAEVPRPEGTPEPETELDTEIGPDIADGERSAVRTEPTLAPPPTHQLAPARDSAALPIVAPLPEPPDAGLLPATRYTIAFARGAWQRRQAVRSLNEQIRLDTTALDGLLDALGRTLRHVGLNNRSLAGENQAIDEAERRRGQAEVEAGELGRRLEEENQRFAEQELDRKNKLVETETALDQANRELDAIEAQRRGLRDKRKAIERQQRAYVKNAEERESEAGKAASDDDRTQHRRTAEDLRREAAALDPERQDLDRRLAALEKPAAQAAAAVEGLRGEQESIRRTLHDLREGHRHRVSELEAEQGRKGRDATTAEAEIARRLVTLGTLLNLNRVERPEFDELYARIDQLRGAIGLRTEEIDRLIAERSSYNRGAVLRGAAVLSLGAVVLTTAVVLVVALL